jgi:hypothetical protein
MNRRERLMATLRGESVDRPPVCFYEIGGLVMDPANPDPFNIYNDPSWKPLLDLAEEKTDLIRMRSPILTPIPGNPREEFFHIKEFMRDGSRYKHTEVHVGGRTLTEVVRRDPEVDTLWVVEHLLKDAEDLKAYLELPDEVFTSRVSVANLIEEEERIGDRGIVLVDSADPICLAAALFSMQDYLLVAFNEKELFHRLLEKLAVSLYSVTDQVACEFPGHLWRIFGPEYATPPYLPPAKFKEYVVRYTGPMVEMIQRQGGFARIHCHGRIREVLPMIARMGAAALDPIEPPPQGNVQLADVRREYGGNMVLFGNIEASDIENLDPPEFEKAVAKTLQDAAVCPGRGFVLMPSSCPYGRTITLKTLTNYETMIRMVNYGIA